MSNNEWQENESEINVCLGKLPLFIHVSSLPYVCWVRVCVCGKGLLWKKKKKKTGHTPITTTRVQVT